MDYFTDDTHHAFFFLALVVGSERWGWLVCTIARGGMYSTTRLEGKGEMEVLATTLRARQLGQKPSRERDFSELLFLLVVSVLVALP